MSAGAIAGIIGGVYVVVGAFTYALCKVSAEADAHIEGWR